MANHTPSSFTSQLHWILFLTSLFLINFLARVLFSPLLPAIEKELGIGHAAAGSLFMYLSSGYFVALLGSSFLSARIPHRLVLAGSAIVTGIILLLSTACNGLGSLRFIALMIGLSCGLYLPSAIAILTDLVEEKHWGKALAIHELAPNLAFTLAPLIAAVMLPHFSWRIVLATPGIFSIAFGLLFLIFGSGGYFRGQVPQLENCRILVIRRAFWITVFLFTLGIASTMGLFNMLPAYLVSHFGMAYDSANTLVSLSRGLTVFTVFLGGWATDRIGASRTLIIVLGITGTITMALGMVPRSSLTLVKTLVFLQPALAVSFFPAGFAILARIAPADSRNITVAMTISVAFLIGGGVVPYAIGLCGDTGHFDFGISIVGLFIASGAIVTPFLNLAQKHGQAT
ncbi:MAG: MFS transporter [Deltaproteobacteria bacterium]|nr:MFS transporter [Candidatus Tharpella aukensis]